MLKNLIQPFLKKDKCFVLAYDHGSNKNPEIFKFNSANPTYIFELAKNINATGIVLNKGIAEIYSKTSYKTPLIIKLDTKSESTNKPVLICSVEYAKQLGAKAIGYTIYFGSEFESEQIKEFSELVEKAHSLNMAAIL
jgi:fructose-bisphosphate aldolase, class I